MKEFDVKELIDFVLTRNSLDGYNEEDIDKMMMSFGLPYNCKVRVI